MNLPNKLTTSRLVMTFAFLAALVSGVPYGKTIALFLFLIASLTDLMDGVIARKRDLITDFGTLMDPVADKVLISAAFIAFVQLPETRIPAWIAVVIVAREFVITGLRLLALSRGKLIGARRGGKNKMVFQVIAVGVVLMFLSLSELFPGMMSGVMGLPFSVTLHVLMYVTVAMTAFTGFLHLRDHKELLLNGV
jgi:CDP-diacylglycerol--glycerol-3-phosphate 3-phosphatidyltransferase